MEIHDHRDRGTQHGEDNHRCNNVESCSTMRAVGNSIKAVQLFAPAAVTAGGRALKRCPHIGINA
jgi:hypothetical protein